MRDRFQAGEKQSRADEVHASTHSELNSPFTKSGIRVDRSSGFGPLGSLLKVDGSS